MTQTIALVGGCPRSGTSALVQMLSAHPDVAIMLERYGSRAVAGEYDASLLTSERVRDYVPEDGDGPCFRSPETQLALSKWDSAKVVGDKIVNIPMALDAGERIADSKVILIVREPVGMAHSFASRLANAKDRWRMNYDVSLKLFNEGMSAAAKAIEEWPASRLLVLEYFHAFADPNTLPRVFSFLGVDPEKADGARAIQDDFGQKQKLAAQLRQFVTMRANYGNYRQVVRHALSQAG